MSGNLNPNRLQVAAEAGDAKTVDILLKQSPRDPETEQNALRTAAAHGHINTAKVLLDHGVDINSGKIRAIEMAASNGHTDMCKLLIDRKAGISLLSLRWAMKNPDGKHHPETLATIIQNTPTEQLKAMTKTDLDRPTLKEWIQRELGSRHAKKLLKNQPELEI